LSGVPEELKSVRIRIRGIDTPEINGKCAVEKELAKEAKTFINKLIKEAHIVRLSNLSWGKYGGRILADLYIDNTNYLVFLKGKAFYTLYQGGKKTKDWCE
jgi:endonuclease YncB( thermonuclease family)